MNPVNWWHQMEGGEIARQRPPPPGSEQAYPNLATVPPRPAAPNKPALDAITQGLVADRAHAQYMAAAAPIADPSSPQASPGLFGAGTMPAAPPPGAPPAARGAAPAATASLAAASGPPAPPQGQTVPGQTVPGQAVPGQANQPAASPPAQPAARGAARSAGRAPATGAPASAAGATTAAGPPPAIPAAPPPPPRLPGAPPARVASAAQPIRPPAAAPGAVEIEFVTGSSVLPPGAGDLLKELAAKRGAAAVALTGHGDATSGDPAAQSAALSLALARAQAVEKALIAAGVPEREIRIGAEASGRGAEARLIH